VVHTVVTAVYRILL